GFGLLWRLRTHSVQLEPVSRARPAEQLDSARDERRGVEDRAADRRREPALQPGEVEKIAHDPPEPLDLAAHNLGEAADLARRERPRRQKLREALERGQRRAQLV